MTTFKLLSSLFLGIVLAQNLTYAHLNLDQHQLGQYRRGYAVRRSALNKRCGDVLRKRYAKRAIKRSNSSLNSTDSNVCLLTPEVTQGPYHILGEQVSQNITFDQVGVPLTIKVDFIDVDTCQPLQDAWVDVWHANATGFYSGFESASSGVITSMNNTQSPSNSSIQMSQMPTALPSGTINSGSNNTNASSSTTTIDSYTAGADSTSQSGGMAGNSPTDGDHFLRGVWQTDQDGLLTMYTIVPGWYTGRAPHIHLKVYDNASGYKAENGTFIANGTGLAHHTGQWFLPTDVMDEIATLSPYDNNTLSWTNATKNDQDTIYPYADSMGTDADLQITYVNQSDITFGLIGQTTVGINMTYASAELTTFYWDPEQSS